MGLTLGGIAGDLTWNTRTKADRWTGSGLRGDNLVVPGRDGAVWRAGKPLEELGLTVSTWIVGADADGGMPHASDGRRLVHERYERLLHTFRGKLGELVDTDTRRRAYAELAGATDPNTMAGATRAEVDLDLTIPAGCWHDLDAFTLADTPIADGTVVTLPVGAGSPLPIIDAVITLTGPGRNVKITEPSGQWLAWSGDLPASKLIIDCRAITAKYQGGSVDYLPRVSWSAVPMLPIAAEAGSPKLTVKIEAAGAASRIQVTGRRRWYSA